MGDLADAYVWAYPLVAMHRTRRRHGDAQRGRMLRRDGLATAADRTVVGPNNDTLYASGWFDLRQGDLVVDVEPMAGRYWSVMVLDAYTNVSYLSRRLHGDDGTSARVVLDPATVPTPERAVDPVPIATPAVWVLARVLVDGPDDLEAARAALGRIHVRQERAAARAASPAPLEPAWPERGSGWFARAAAALAVDPPAPWMPPAPTGFVSRVASGDVPPADEQDAARAEGEARIDAGAGVDRRVDGWGTRSRGAVFGDDVAYRASFAKVSLAGHRPAENRSYNHPVDGRRSHAIRFEPGGEPPVGAFWSLTMYGPDLFFVDNPIDRYSIGDRTPGLVRADDGSLTITVGHERPQDDANWLPAPDGPCFCVLRCYEGAPAIVAAEWFPPPLVPLEPPEPR